MVPRQVDFKVPKIQCEDADEVPYTDCQDKEKEQMTTKMTCEVKHTTNCEAVTSTKCANINYQECAEVPEEECETVEMQVITNFEFSRLFVCFDLPKVGSTTADLYQISPGFVNKT